MNYTCKQCGKVFEAKPSDKGRFCSLKCYWLYRKENKMLPPSRKGAKISKAHKQALRDWWKDHPDHNKFKKGEKAWNKGRPMPEIRKEKHGRWTGGRIKHPDKRIRNSAEYKDWRAKVFKRDNYTCQLCGKRGGELHADHIKPFATHPELRFDVNNGRTLCVPCHKKTSTYGRNIKKLNYVK